MKYNISNLEKILNNTNTITTEIKPVNFLKETCEDIEKSKNDLIENQIKELIKPYLDVKYHEFKPYELNLVEKALKDQGYKVGCIEDEHYTTYFIKNIITKEMDYFLIKNNTEIKQEGNKYTATNYISSIIRGIKDK